MDEKDEAVLAFARKSGQTCTEMIFQYAGKFIDHRFPDLDPHEAMNNKCECLLAAAVATYVITIQTLAEMQLGGDPGEEFDSSVEQEAWLLAKRFVPREGRPVIGREEGER